MTGEKHSALLMALYTFLLALGAAMPLAASFQPGLAAHGPEGAIRCGGHSRPVTVEASDEDEAGERPRTHPITCADATELGLAPSVASPTVASPRDPSFRGS